MDPILTSCYVDKMKKLVDSLTTSGLPDVVKESTNFFILSECLGYRQCLSIQLYIIQGMSLLRSLIPFRLSHLLETSAYV